MNGIQLDLLTTPDALIAYWQKRNPATWPRTPEVYMSIAEKAVEMGHPSLAYDILKEGLSLYPEYSSMTYLAALALARSGSSRSACEILEPTLHRISSNDPDYMKILSLAGRLEKDRGMKLESANDRKNAFLKSAMLYMQAYEHSGDYYPGINAATMYFISGDTFQGRRIAAEIKSDCESRWDESSNDYWLAATVGEACLLLEERQSTIEWYTKATTRADGRYGDIASIRRQVNLLACVMQVDPAILKVLHIPRVVVFTGHMIDHADRDDIRFPSGIVSAVRTAISIYLESLDAGFGYCSAACGADLLFIEAMLERGAEVHIVLPFQHDDFIKTSVAFAGTHWIECFNRALQHATSVQYATEEGYLGDDVLFHYCSQLIQGMALLRSQQLESDPVLLAVQEPNTARKTGGTAITVEHWESLGHAVEIINLKELRNTHLSSGYDYGNYNHDVRINNGAHKHYFPHLNRTLKTMLFADVVGFSRLGEEEAPSFFLDFLRRIAKVIEDSPVEPLFCNTWGDGLFMVFGSVLEAANFALRLRDMVLAEDWPSIGLPENTNIRIGLHSGPVYSARDPVIHRLNFYGTHVNRAARIEPIATPGSIFISEQTACLLVASGSNEYTCDYLGEIELAKKFGRGVLYRLRRTDQVE